MALSDDLRKRVVEAVIEGGLSRNAAARRFEVSIASAVRWVKRYETTGEISPAPSGGDRRSRRIEAHRGASRLSAGFDPPHAGHHAAGNEGAAHRQLRRALFGFRAVALLRPSRDHG